MDEAEDEVQILLQEQRKAEEEFLETRKAPELAKVLWSEIMNKSKIQQFDIDPTILRAYLSVFINNNRTEEINDVIFFFFFIFYFQFFFFDKLLIQMNFYSKNLGNSKYLSKIWNEIRTI